MTAKTTEKQLATSYGGNHVVSAWYLQVTLNRNFLPSPRQSSVLAKIFSKTPRGFIKRLTYEIVLMQHRKYILSPKHQYSFSIRWFVWMVSSYLTTSRGRDNRGGRGGGWEGSMADFNRVATTSTSYRFLGYTTLFLTTNPFFFFFFSFSERQGDNLQLWISSNCKLAVYHLTSIAMPIKMYQKRIILHSPISEEFFNFYCPHLEYDFWSMKERRQS